MIDLKRSGYKYKDTYCSIMSCIQSARNYSAPIIYLVTEHNFCNKVNYCRHQSKFADNLYP